MAPTADLALGPAAVSAGRLAKLLALANRGGTPEEAALALRRAEELAEREGLRVMRTSDGALVAVDEWTADLLEALGRIADPPERREIEGGGT